MKKTVKYRQCGLAQGNRAVVGWIEERGAILGAKVEVEELGGLWEVTGVGTTVLDKEKMHEMENRSRESFTALKSYRGNK
jgi:hypothetical protein